MRNFLNSRFGHFLFLLLIVAFVYALGYSIARNKQLEPLAVSDNLKAMVVQVKGTLKLDPRTQESDCHVRGPLPDHHCTPGAVFKEATTSQICVKGYTQVVRKVSVSLKKKVYAQYGISYPPPFGSYEADHLIPLALGGNNDIANLFPESAEPRPGFREKDLVEVYLHDEVCAGKIDLAVAQKLIADDCVSVYNSLPPEQLKKLSGRYGSWADRGN